METEAMDTDTGEVRIKQEHAYAFSEVTNTNAGRVQTLEEDPLKLTDQDADKIKAETEEVQIKIEVDHESFDCSMIKTENSELSLSETTSDMDKASGTGDGHVICKINNSYSITDDGESGSSPQMVDLLNKNKNMEYRILTSNNLIEQLQRENKSLKATISKLNLSKESDKSLNSIFENFNKDINGARSLACNLQGEMRQLEQQSEQLQKRIIEVSSLHKSYDHLKRKIATLKFQASQLYNVKNNSAEALKAMKSHVIQKENANININTRLESSLIKLGRLKSKILEMNRLKIQNAEISKLNEEMRRQLNDNKKIRRLYEDHADLIKKQVHSTVKEKEHAIEKLKKEIDELTTINRHKTTVITKLSNRQKDLEQKQEAAVSEWKNTVAEAQESLHTERDKLKQKNNELVFLREEVAMLKVELEKNTMKKCEYCGM